MLASRRVLAAAGGNAPKPAGAWEALKSKFKSRFMIGDTYEHYIPPRPEYQNRSSRYNDTDSLHYRVPAPGSQPQPIVPRGYPETEYDISLAKRPSLKLTGPVGQTVSPGLKEKEELPTVSASGVRYMPRHVPTPSWVYNREQIKRLRRLYNETGVHLAGVPNAALRRKGYYPLVHHQRREEWEDVEVIRDIRIPRL